MLPPRPKKQVRNRKTERKASKTGRMTKVVNKANVRHSGPRRAGVAEQGSAMPWSATDEGRRALEEAIQGLEQVLARLRQARQIDKNTLHEPVTL